jgi:tail tube GTA-gp10-like protein
LLKRKSVIARLACRNVQCSPGPNALTSRGGKALTTGRNRLRAKYLFRVVTIAPFEPASENVAMPNPHRGEIEACLDGRPYTLCLTLGALAELEHAFGHEDMLALAERFQKGRLSAGDAQRIIAAGLRGAGHDIPDEAVARMQADGAAAGFVDIVARLLSATFGVSTGVSTGVRPCGSDPMAPATSSASGGSDTFPFPGKT